MKTQAQTSAEMTHLAEKLSSHRVAMLTVWGAAGELSSRPMTPLEMDSEGAFWIMTSRKSMAAVVGAAGAPVNLGFVDEDKSDFISVIGQASLVEDASRKAQLWTPAGRPWFDGPDDPDLTLLRIRPQRVELWDGPDSTVVRTLAMAASVIAGHEVGLGHKEVIEVPAGR